MEHRAPGQGGAKRKEPSSSQRKKSVEAPVSFKLHTELLAERRKQQNEEKEVAQLRHAQLKILGKKTVEDFAYLKLMRRETATTRSRSLHCNGKSKGRPVKKSELLKPGDRHAQSIENIVNLESRPLQSARASSPRMVLESLPQRPQSAKPVLQSHPRSAAQHHATDDEDEDLLNDRHSKSLQSKKKRKKKIARRKSGRLTPSKSAPVLPDTPKCTHSSKKINIIVNLRDLQLSAALDSPSEVSPPVIAREAWAEKPGPRSNV